LSAAAGLPLPQVVKAGLGSGRELATMLDLSKCIGCEECVYACREANEKYMPGNPKKPFPKMYPARVKVEDWSERQEVTDRLTPYNWLYIQRAEVAWQGEEVEVNIPRRCMHCQNPPCVNLCPWGAAKKQDNGLSRLDPDFCLGGAKCRTVCPWHIPQRQTGVGLYLDLAPGLAGNGVMYKCHRCYEKLDQGEVPACIEACPEQVQTIGPREEILAMAHARAEEINGYIYGEHENGGTNTIYVSPVPFEEIDNVLEKELQETMKSESGGVGRKHVQGRGPGREQKVGIGRAVRQGRPHLGPVENSMAKQENLTAALLLAPVAGAAVAWAKVRKFLGRTEETGADGKEGQSNGE
jgi:Fe-S-cluster-containing dehydrogenase component